MTTPEQFYFKPHPQFLTISDNLHSTYSFDGEGRLIGAFRDGVTYRRGLQGDILLKQAQPGASKLRHMLDPAERHSLLSAVHQHVGLIYAQAQSNQPNAVVTWLERVLGWDVARLEAERERFQAIYKPISILPPDQYLSLVLQATEGCSWNRCSFCTFYRDRAFRIKTPAAFRSHVQQIKAFMGAGITLRKALFLGDANALIMPQARLRELLTIIHEEFAVDAAHSLKGIYAFLDIFGAEQKDLVDYHELREAQVQRIYLGLESGAPEVFRLLNKPGSPAACIEAVQMIKAAGINVGVILLAGAGGIRLAPDHVTASLEALAAMGLGSGDLVYVSPLIVAPDSPYMQQLHAAQSAPLAPAALALQLEQLKVGAKAVCGPGAKTALYHIEEFIY